MRSAVLGAFAHPTYDWFRLVTSWHQAVASSAGTALDLLPTLFLIGLFESLVPSKATNRLQVAFSAKPGIAHSAVVETHLRRHTMKARKGPLLALTSALMAATSASSASAWENPLGHL